MHQHHAHALTRIVTSLPSRRDVLRGLATSGLGLVVLRTPDTGGAKKKRKHKDKKPKLQRNEYGCVDVGGKCLGNSANCCSGICEGKKPKKGKRDTSRCVGHNVDACQSGQRSIVCDGTGMTCTLPDGGNGQCETTTGNAGYCGGSSISCLSCTKDTDCHALCGAGAACIACTGCADGTACAGTSIHSCSYT